MPENTNEDWTALPFAQWLEECIREMIKARPVAIGMEMVGEDGLVSTCYYNVSPNDRACMVDAMRDDTMWDFIRGNREEIRAILSDDYVDEENDEDEPCEAD